MHQWEDFSQNYLFLLPIFPPLSHSVLYFLSCRPFVVNATFSTSTKPVENVVLMTKGLQERKNNIEWDDGGKQVIKIHNFNSSCLFFCQDFFGLNLQSCIESFVEILNFNIISQTIMRVTLIFENPGQCHRTFSISSLNVLMAQHAAG